LSRSPQYGQTQTHFSIAFPHSIQIANSSLFLASEAMSFLKQDLINGLRHFLLFDEEKAHKKESFSY
jgi:hypothetical protein